MYVVESFKGKAVADQRVEIVERKGIGHPDFMCDSIMEAISVALSRYYLDRFDTILHHNIDKGLLSAGRVQHSYGGGRVIKPMELTIGDRATFKVGRQTIPVKEIAFDAAKSWIASHLPHVDVEADIRWRSALAPGSAELTDIFARGSGVRAANDTSAAVGYYPMTPTEQAILGFERYLNSTQFKQRFPETGQDVKVMGLRNGRRLQLTVAMPLLTRYVRSEAEYFERKQAIHQAMQKHVHHLEGFEQVDVYFNSLDEAGRGMGGIYLSLLGTSAEDADSGQVGRGNRVNGVIALNRPLGTEAAAGKNPVSHVGKIYNMLAHRLAQTICESVEGIREVYILMLSQIGSPVDQPQVVNAQLLLEPGHRLQALRPAVRDVIERELARMETFCMQLAQGKYPVC